MLYKKKNRFAEYVKDSIELKKVLAHELINTFHGCMNHGNKFKLYADLTKKKLGIDVEVRASKETMECSGMLDAKKKKAKYTIECQKCGETFYGQRKSNLVLYPEKYLCKCGGNLKIV